MPTDSYKPLARAFHWATAVLIALQAAFGFIMVYDGPEPNFWATLTDRFQLYDSHKVLGVALLALALVRLGYRAARGAPPPLTDVPRLQRTAAGAAHALLYVLIVVVPLLGWLGISLYPALTVFGNLRLPALASPDRAMSETVLFWHAWGAFALVALALLHAGAALHHHFVRRDRTLLRMLGR